MRAVDGKAVSALHLDSRIKIAIVVNPEFGTSFAPDSRAAIKRPALVVALGGSDDAAALAQGIEGARYEAIADADALSAISPCTSQAISILAEAGEDDAICREDGPRSRREIQAEIGSLIEVALARVFNGQP